MSEKEFCKQLEHLEDTAEHIQKTLTQLEAKLETLLPPPITQPLHVSHSICGKSASNFLEPDKINKLEEIERKSIESSNVSSCSKTVSPSKKSFFETWYNILFKTVRNHPYRFIPTPHRPLREYLRNKLYSTLNLH